ncbi:MAG: LicD family protein [Clostridia bacterium]|nr:LicD family protein [Clostridia bacterium]
MEDLDKLKKIETELLKQFIQVCDKLNLRYYIMYGTLIGAIRHKGFIPWDDDIDVGMPREDYELFVKKAQSLLPENVFVQTIDTEPNHPFAFCKLRDNNTAFIEDILQKHKINHGVWVDVFPLDNYPEDPKVYKKVHKKRKFYKRVIESKYCICAKSLTVRLKKLLKKLTFCLFSAKKAVKRLDELFKAQPKSHHYVNHSASWGPKEALPVEWFGNGVLVDFEGLKVNAPEKYHELLTKAYGDYMTPPPEDKRGSFHNVILVDTEKSWREYFK